MRVAVMGASGFIGSRLVERLHLTGVAEVRPVVRATARLAGPARFALDCRVADARDRRALAEALAGCDAAVHAVAGDRATIVRSAEAAYRAAADAGVRRLVYLSTASVHGQAPAASTDERSPLTRRQPVAYNRSKIDAENLLRGLRRSGPVELVMLRPGIVYGPRSYWTGGLADELLSGEAYLVEGGAGICNAIYVDNLMQAIELALSAPGIDGEAFLLGEEETVTWRDLYQPIVEALGMSMEDVPNLSFDGRRDWAGEARRAADRLPPLARRALAGAYRAMHRARSSGRSPFMRAAPPLPKPTLERALLHRCSTKLPWTKARDRLGYGPSVSFEEGCRRSLAWLEFAGYPVARRS